MDDTCPGRRLRSPATASTLWAPWRLSAEQFAQLPALLDRGAAAYGFRGQLWNCGRIAAVLHLMFGVWQHQA
jgi:hypothetical protein